MSWVSVVTPPCKCVDRPNLNDGPTLSNLRTNRVGPGSKWQCPELDCNRVWEWIENPQGISMSSGIAALPLYLWKLVHVTVGGSNE